MAKDVDREQEKKDRNRIDGVGDGWKHVDSKLAAQIIGGQVFVKSFSVRRNFDGDDAYTSKWFLILRASVSGADVVKFRRFSSLLNLPFLILDMVRSDKGWREDRWASEP